MRRQGLTFVQWLKRRRTDSAFDKFLINIGEENDLRNYRDFCDYFHDVYKKLPAYFDKNSVMYEANFQAAMTAFTRLYDGYEHTRYHKEYRTAF